MPRPSRITVYVLGAWLCGVGWRSAVAADDFAFYYENVMGTSLELVVRADDAEAARGAEGRVLREIDRLTAIFSGHDPASEFRRWQATEGPREVSPELFEVLRACDRWRTQSGGAFDPRVQALTRLWSGCAAQGRTPTPEELGGAKALMARPAWRLDPGSGTAECLADGPLTLDAIAKGDIIERACAAALGEGRGVRGLLLNVGGDLRVGGDTARTIGIAAPRGDSETTEPLAYVEVRGKAVATSGDSQRGLRIDGRWYSHIFDPRSGAPAQGAIAATVIADRSADADALATIFNVLAPEDSLHLADSLPGVECLIVAADGRIARSAGWHRYERPRPAELAFADAQAPPAAEAGGGAAQAPAGAPWGDEFELLVDFEINRPEGGEGPYRRPYVAVWVEDQEGFPVRTLVLWVSFGGAGPFQWLPEMKRWYRSDAARYRVDKTNLIRTVARPTRPPGRYSVLWDGKDNHGRPLPRGQYTLCIDAAREHGTYQGIRTPVTVADAPFAEELQGNVEIRSASIAYRRKAPAQ
jgi:thiamine biosynthesis lipoprotein